MIPTRLPEDIRRLQARKAQGKIAALILCLLAEAILFYFSADYLIRALGAVNTAGIFLGFALAVGYLLKLHVLLFDRTYAGKVTQVFVETLSKVELVGAKAVRPRMTNQISVMLEEKNGKTRLFVLPQGISCHVGDTLLHVKGMRSPLIFENGENKKGMCAVCGATKQHQPRCAICGHTILQKL